MLISEAIEYGRRMLDAVTENSGLETQWLLEWVLERDRLYILLNGTAALSEEAMTRFDEALNRRVLGEPLQYIIGEQEFMGLSFKVSPAVLIPRRDTECLVEAAVSLLEQTDAETPKVIDLGAGSGAIGLSVAHFVRRANVIEVDLSASAVAQTRENVERLQLSGQVTVVHCDMFDFLENLETSSVDAILSNPPYIPDGDIEGLQVEVKCHEPRMALAGGEDGLAFYRRLAATCHKPLKSGGFILFEVGHDQAQAVSQLLLDAGSYKEIKCYRDLQGIERAVAAYKK